MGSGPRMLPNRLVTMVNQIGKFFAVQAAARGGEDSAVADIAAHLQRFWDPRMRDAIIALPEEDKALLDPLPRRAVALLAAPRPTPDGDMQEPTGG